MRVLGSLSPPAVVMCRAFPKGCSSQAQWAACVKVDLKEGQQQGTDSASVLGVSWPFLSFCKNMMIRMDACDCVSHLRCRCDPVSIPDVCIWETVTVNSQMSQSTYSNLAWYQQKQGNLLSFWYINHPVQDLVFLWGSAAVNLGHSSLSPLVVCSLKVFPLIPENRVTVILPQWYKPKQNPSLRAEMQVRAAQTAALLPSICWEWISYSQVSRPLEILLDGLARRTNAQHPSLACAVISTRCQFMFGMLYYLASSLLMACGNSREWPKALAPCTCVGDV